MRADYARLVKAVHDHFRNWLIGGTLWVFASEASQIYDKPDLRVASVEVLKIGSGLIGLVALGLMLANLISGVIGVSGAIRGDGRSTWRRIASVPAAALYVAFALFVVALANTISSEFSFVGAGPCEECGAIRE